MSAIGKHIKSWLEKKGLRKKDILVAMGYSNMGKGIRRLDRVLEGRIADDVFMEKLRLALGEVPEDFKVVVDATHAENREEEKRRAAEREAHERANFSPYIYIDHENARPSQIFIVAFVGIKRFKHLPLPGDIASWPEVEQLLHIKNVIREHQLSLERNSPFGLATGYSFRRTFDEFVRFDLEGRVLDTYSGRPEEGRTVFKIGNKVVEKMPGLGV